jgi:lactoylglutathione lyase
MKMTLNYLRLLVPNFQDCFRFYRDMLQLEIVGGKEEWEYIEFKLSEGTYLAMMPQNEMSAVLGTGDLPSDTPCQDRVGLIFPVENVDEEFRQLRERGVTFLLEPTDRPEWGMRAAHFRDPAGTLIEINTNL